MGERQSGTGEIMSNTLIQLTVFVGLTALIGWLTFIKCRAAIRANAASNALVDENKEIFLAGGGLSWVFVAGSITLTNLSTDQLVGMNGNQMMLLAWWELAAVAGLVVLAKVFLPVYYKYKCTTTTELLEIRFNDPHIRALISTIFLLGNIFIFVPAILYGASLFMKTMFDVELPLILIAALFGFSGAAYAVLGGLRAVAVSDTYSGVLLLGFGLLVVALALIAIDFDFSGIPKERLTMIGGPESPIPWPTLLTGMIFIQIFYWSTNQTITQRALASPTLREGQKGVFAAGVIRLLIVPPMIVLPGVVSYKLYGDVGDAAYGRIVSDLLPVWLSGAFAAAIAASVLTTVNSMLNASTALYVCDIHQKYFNKKPNVRRLNAFLTFGIVIVALILVPVYAKSESIINTIQELYGLLSMPILSAFIVGLAFSDVDSRAAIIGVVLGVSLYGFFTFVWAPLHYIHMMLFTLIVCVAAAIVISKYVFKTNPRLSFSELRGESNA